MSVGNTRTAVGHFHDERAAGVRRFGNADLEGIVECVREAWAHRGEEDGEIVVASVNDATAIAVEAAVASALHADVWRLGRDLEVPIGRCLDEGATPGQDRLLAAAAAFAGLAADWPEDGPTALHRDRAAAGARDVLLRLESK